MALPGPCPPTGVKWNDLTALDVGANALTETLPTDFSQLGNLMGFALFQENNFTGSVNHDVLCIVFGRNTMG